MRTMYIMRTDDRPTSHFGKSNGHISATGYPIHFTFGSRVGLNFEVGGSNLPTSGWTKSKMAAGRHLGKFQMAISLERGVRSTSCLILGYRFSGTADRMDLLPLRPNPRSRPSAVLHNFEWPYHSLIRFIRYYSYLFLG